MRNGFHKIISIIFAITFLFLIPPVNIFAQTDDTNSNLSFVVNSQMTYYGFNAGSGEKELRFRFSQQNRQNLFFIDLFENNQFFTIGAYSNRGVFVLLQDHPGSHNQNRLTPSEFEYHFSDLLTKFPNLPEISFEGYSMDAWIIPNSNLILGDKSGKTLIIYSEKEDFQIIENELPYIGITYYYPYNVFNKNLDNNGEDSYQQQLMDRINQSDENFSEVFGLDILTEFQPINSRLTSVLISPNENQVYVSLNKNANEVWRFDINGGTVETHTGFEKNHKANIPKLGITSSDLQILNFSNEDLTMGIIGIAIVILLIIIFSIVVYIPRDKQVKTSDLS